jgi:hypothetical protein
MTSQIPPDPITNEYNPSAWSIPELTEDERVALDKAYIKFPIAQNQPITFPSAITIPTPVPESNTTLATTTAWVRTFWASVLAAANSWSGLQTFSGGIITNTINPTSGGTLLIGHASTTTNVEVASQTSRSVVLHLGDGANSGGGIHIGNGAGSNNNVQILNGSGSGGTITLGSSTSTTSLGCALTPTYNYPVASDKIGYILTGTFANVPNLVVNTTYQLASLSIPSGVWIINGEAGLTIASTNGITIAFNTSVNLSTARGRQTNLYTNAVGFPLTASTYTISLTTTTTYYLIGSSSQPVGGGYSWNNIVMTATRIA